MTTLITYDSNFGNTKLAAETIARELGSEARAMKVDDVTPGMLAGLKLLIVGSPINGWRPTPKITALLSGLKPGQLNGVKAATFDTRVKLFIHGDAAKTMAKMLTVAGATMVADPQPLYVKGKEGPLLEGEVERAKQWAKQIGSKS